MRFFIYFERYSAEALSMASETANLFRLELAKVKALCVSV